MSEVTLTVIDRAGATRQVKAFTGDVLMHVLRDNIDNDVGICGGEMSCGTCLVKLSQQWFEEMTAASDDEQEMLEALAAPEHARLGCQLLLNEAVDGMQLTLLHED